jgi:pyruvate,water dikinase
VSVRPLGDLRREHAPEFGGKAANLGELTASGIPVPPGFALGASDYGVHAERCDLRSALKPLLAKEKWAEAEMTARELLGSAPLDPDLTSVFLRAFRNLGSPTVAVRSSAIGEDAPDASFAGQYYTKLEVSGEEALLDAVRSCWASLWNKAVLEYRHRRALGPLTQGTREWVSWFRKWSWPRCRVSCSL